MEPERGWLCVPCLESRLGRPLVGADFRAVAAQRARRRGRHTSTRGAETRRRRRAPREEVDVSGSPARKSPQYRRNRATIRARGDPYARCAIESGMTRPATSSSTVCDVRTRGRSIAVTSSRWRSAAPRSCTTCRRSTSDVAGHRRQALPAAPVRTSPGRWRRRTYRGGEMPGLSHRQQPRQLSQDLSPREVLHGKKEIADEVERIASSWRVRASVRRRWPGWASLRRWQPRSMTRRHRHTHWRRCLESCGP